jgi:hypothetical protein
MAGRYQGYHVFRDMDGGHRSVEVFWHHNGWFWRPCEPRGDAVGPFTTSTEAYESAKVHRAIRERLSGSGLASRARARG